MAVDIATQSAFAAGKPRMLFEGPYLPTAATIQNYDVSPDGQPLPDAQVHRPSAGGADANQRCAELV
jgi:hypothetical protein